MKAIPNSRRTLLVRAKPEAKCGVLRRRAQPLLALACAAFSLLLPALGLALAFAMPFPSTLLAQTDTNESAVVHFQRLYQQSRKDWQTESNRVESARKFASACFDWADFVSDQGQRADIAHEGIHAARRAIALDPKSAAGYYYLALDLGQLARTKLFGALKLVNEMEESFQRCIELEPKFNYAGAYRSLGMLYRDAPGWPTSLGDRGKARSHLKKAVELCPEYPDNQLTYIESLLNWGEKKAVADQFAAVEATLKKARERFTGGEWRFAWPDWDERWEKVKNRAGVVSARSPREP